MHDTVPWRWMKQKEEERSRTKRGRRTIDTIFMHSGHVPSFLCVMYLQAKFCSFLFTFSFEKRNTEEERHVMHDCVLKRERGKKRRNLHKGESLKMFYERYLLGNNSIIMRDTKIAVLWKLSHW